MKVALSNIKSIQPRRDHGDIAGLKASIAEVGLINPLTLDSDYNLLAGRRRFQAVTELGWTDVDCHILPVNGDQLKAFRVTLDENLKRKPLTDLEVATAIKEYDELKHKLAGQAKGGTRTDLGHSVTEVGGWSYQKTADDLGISKAAVVKATKITTAIERHPELAEVGRNEGGEAVLREVSLLEGRPRESPIPGLERSTYERIIKAMITLRKLGSTLEQVLAAEDELQKITKPILASLGDEVEAANTLPEAVKLWRKASFLAWIWGEVMCRRDWRMGISLATLEPGVKRELVKQVGIEKRDLKRIEKVASVPENIFEDYIQGAWDGDDDPPTRRELLRLSSFGKLPLQPAKESQ